MAYNSSYTGPEIDSAIGSVKNKEKTWDSKQDKLNGTEDQLVGFNSSGDAVAVAAPDPLPSGGTEGQILTLGADGPEWSDAPSGLPDGGTEGQVLTKGESGPEWGDKPVMYVNITESGGTYSADKSVDEISAAYQSGYSIFAVVGSFILPLNQASIGEPTTLSFWLVYSEGYFNVVIYKDQSTESVNYTNGSFSASSIEFTPKSSISSDNVQGAIEEVNAKATPKSVYVTLSASGWASNAQTVTVNGVLADETKQLIQPMPTVASQSAYIEAGIICTAQAAGQLTFTCSTVPTADLQVYVVIQEVGA